jgi:hypothetical protein
MRKFLLIITVIALLGGLTIGGFWFVSHTTSFRQAVVDTAVRSVIHTTSTEQSDLLHRALGFERPRTYLLLFLNNTEIRPGGGFIGSYGVIRISNGIPELLKTEGTEILDHSVPEALYSIPPAPLQKYLKISKWQFRDSNWSPDFTESTKKSLELYRLEKGLLASELDGVIAFTPTIMHHLLELTGPITVQGLEFTSTNFTRQLEHEVEYGYKDRGYTFSERKQIMRPLALAILRHVATDALTRWSDYTALVPKFLAEKQVILYSLHADEQKVITDHDWGGEAPHLKNEDFVMWVDANLGALKTDLVMDRSLSYTFKPLSNGQYQATVAMTFRHTGVFDKFTSRYRDYARVYVPSGSKLVSSSGAMDADKSTAPGKIDQGSELGRQWFGAFISIEPGKTKTLSFTYLLPKQVVEEIKNGSYTLLVEKQLGAEGHRLTLGLDFGTTLASAYPGEDRSKHGDARYDFVTNLLIDRQFSVVLKR